MSFSLVSVFALSWLLLVSQSRFADAAPPRHIAYTVEVADVVGKTYHVTARAEAATDAQVSFAMPAWSPGWYVLTRAYQNVGQVSAVSETGASLAVSHPDKLTWTVQRGQAESVTLRYDLKARDNDPDIVGAGVTGTADYGFFAPYLDADHGFVPGPASLLYVVGATQIGCQVQYKVPSGWAVASANDPVPGDPMTFSAPDYDTLADQPAELGKFERVDKTISGIPVSVVLVGAEGASSRRFVSACWKIVQAGMKVLGGTDDKSAAPFPRYLFFFHFPEGMQGIEGLEHKNSTVIRLPRESLDGPDTSALSVVAHEFTHAWNVKRIRSRALGPFDYTRAVRTRDLWWLEGVTDYYAPRLLMEAGLVSRTYWRAYVSEIITGLQNNPARRKVTLEEASLKAWEGRSEGYGGLSYYEKGLVVGLLLDVEMRKRTGGKVGLDDVMHALLKQQAEAGQGFTDGEIERTASRLADVDLKPFFDRALRSTEELPIETLKEAGLRVRTTPLSLPDVGVEARELAHDGDGLRLTTVSSGSRLARAGVQSGDVLTRIDGRPVLQIMGALMGYAKAGDTLRLTVRRGDETLQLPLVVGSKEVTLYSLVPSLAPTEAQLDLLARISGAAPAP